MTIGKSTVQQHAPSDSAREPAAASAAACGPIIRQAAGELSLSFGDPTIQSSMRLSDPDHLLLDYTRTMMSFLLLHPAPQYIAMIGLGGGSLAKYCHARLPDADFTAIEIAAEIIGLRRTFGVPDDNARFRVVHADGAAFLAHHATAFDVVLVDGFDRSGQPPALCSLAFYADCRLALRPGGMLAVNLCTDDALHRSYLDRMGTAFDQRVLTLDADEGANRIAFAFADRMPPLSLQALAQRLRVLEPAHANIDLARSAQKLMRRPTP